MTELLLKLFVKNHKNTADPLVRTACGKLAGCAGMLCNIFLFASKFAVGVLSGSIAVTADAFNNLSDASSNIISLIGFSVASRPADDEHPFGHARSEYIASLGVALLILLIAIELFKSSLTKVLHPTEVEFSLPLLGVLLLSMAVKLWMALMNKKIGSLIDSSVLRATAQDSLNDVITTCAVLIGILVARATHLLLDGYFGIGVSLFIAFSGLGIIKDTLSLLLGHGADAGLCETIEKKILSYEGVVNTHDLMVHDYGPGHRFASVHVEIDAATPVLVSHDIIDNIERDILSEMNIHLVIHYDPILIGDKESDETAKKIRDILFELSDQLSMHDFRMVKGAKHTNLIFDVVVPGKSKLTEAEIKSFLDERLSVSSTNCHTIITFDHGMTTSRDAS